MRESKAITWAELESKPPNARPPTYAVSDGQQLPAIRNADCRPGHVSPNSASLPPIPRKKHIQAYVPPQQRPKLSSMMMNHGGERPIHNLMGRYIEPHSPEVNSQDELQTIGDSKRSSRFLKSTSAIKTEATKNHGHMADVFVKESIHAMKYSFDTRESSDQGNVQEPYKISIDPVTAIKTTKPLTGAIHARPKTTFRSIIQCPDAPLLPGRREPYVPCPPLEPHDNKLHRNVHGSLKMEHERGKTEMNVDDGHTKFPSISRSGNVVICRPPDTPKTNGCPRRKWKTTTMKREN